MKIVKVLQTTLAAPLAANDTSFTVKELVDSKNLPVVLASWGAEAYFVLVLKQGDTTEIIKCSAIVQNDDGSAEMTVATNGRDIDPTTPYAGHSTGQDFQTGADVIATNDPLTMSRFATLSEDNSFSGLNTFSTVPQTTSDPIHPNDMTRLSYIQTLILGTLTTIDVIVPAKAGATIAAGQLCYFDDSSNEWKLAQADTSGTVNNVLLGIAQGAGVSGGAIAGGILLQGVDSNQTGLVEGDTEYASDTPGLVQNTQGTIKVSIGIAKSATELYFDPRFNQQLTQDEIDALAGTSGAPSGTNKFVTNNDTSATSAAGKLIRANGSGKIDTSFLSGRFGGSGADGALAIASGTTTIDLAGARYVVKNYTSISITGTGALAFINPHADGSVVHLRSQGDVTITTSATRAIDLRSLGGQQGQGEGGAVQCNIFLGNSGGNLPGAGGGSKATGGGSSTATIGGRPTPALTLSILRSYPGGGGAAGSPAGYDGFDGRGGAGAGGTGAGGLVIECAGAYNFTGTIDASGSVGSASSAGSFGNASSYGGSGGGGAGGKILVVYNTLTADSGTYTVTGAVGGTASAITGGTGSDGEALRGLNPLFI